MIERFQGSMLGLALGDALGAPHEGALLGRALWKLLGAGKGDLLRWTDDTQMSVGLAESLIEREGLDPDHLAGHWAALMDPLRGYGAGAVRLLRRIRAGQDWRTANKAIFPDGSYGNGGAMRAAPLGLFFHRDLDELRRATELATSITHAHPLGIEAALLIARAVSMALEDPLDPGAFLDTLLDSCEAEEYRSRLSLVREWLDDPPDGSRVKERLGCSVLAHKSAVTAIYAFLHFRKDFKGMMGFIVGLGGDTDTIGAMAGGIFGAHGGKSALPGELLHRLETRERIEDLGRALHDCPGRP